MIYRQTPEGRFWNDPKIVANFAQRPPDPLVLRRLSQIPTPQSKVILDIGCGTGRNSVVAMALGFVVHMCDPNPAMVEAALKSIRLGVDKSTVCQRIVYGVITALPYRSQLFDAVIACGVLHQASSFTEYELALGELDRVTSPGCVVMLNIFTDKVVDTHLARVAGEPHSFVTAEGLPMTLLPKKVFFTMMSAYGFQLEEEICEEVKKENTGPRAILRANFVKIA